MGKVGAVPAFDELKILDAGEEVSVILDVT
jgi:hypothetical protein